jgi:hypothetical protein
MNIMKKIFSTLFVVLFATSMMAQSGLTCEDPIYVGEDYEAKVDGPCELWYTANTYDLPLHVYFIPDADKSSLGPIVEIDFTCEPGVYADRKLDSLVNMVEDFSISFPIELWTEEATLNDKTVWDLDVQKSYREQLADFGITYPVQAFVKVTFFEAGTITMTPDTAFSSCMDNAHYVTLGETINISANDTERAFVFPYTEWQEDSIRFVWDGAEPAQVYVAVQECSFAPGSSYVFDSFEVAQDAPRKLYSEDMKAAIKEHKEGGLYYAKVVAPGAGQLVVEKIPMSAVEGDAQVLEHGQTVSITAQSEQLYCFPKTWTGTEFTASTTGAVKLFVSTVANFSALENDDNVLKVYELDKVNGRRTLQMSNKEMAILTSRATGDYLYVRMTSENPTILAINEWVVSSCADNSNLLRANKEQSVASKSYQTIYRLRYDEFSGYPITVKWTGNSTLPMFLAEDCNLDLSNNASNLLINPSPVLSRKGSLEIDAATVDSWANRISEDGFMYVCFNPGNTGRVTFVTDKPAEETPVLPEPEYVYESYAVCFGDTYVWKDDQVLTETGKYLHTTTGENGAEIITELTFTVHPQTPDTTEEVTIPFGETYEWNGQTYSTAGEYTITLQDANKCDYQATLILSVSPEEKPVNPCVENSELLEPTANLTLSLKDVFDVYRIDCEAWMASGVNLVWKGKAPLHTFVAMDCVFAVAKAHIDVVNYTEVPADGQVILSKEILSDLAQYSREGFLYVRFATEFEGELTIVPAE